MAVERLVSPVAEPLAEERNWSLRPRKMAEYIGQPDLIERLDIAIRAVKARNEPMEHVLLHGPPGLGKTTLAHVIAEEMGTKVHVTSGPALTRPTDLVGALTRLEHGDVLFIDEIHRLPIAVEEFIYPAMEDFRIDVRMESGLHAQTVQINTKPFTLIGATTRAGLVSAPLRSRFGIAHNLRYYTAAELLTILTRSCELLGVSATQASRQNGEGPLGMIAARSRGTPRIANRLLRRVRDFAQVRGDGVLTAPMVTDSLALEGVDELGLDELDRALPPRDRQGLCRRSRRPPRPSRRTLNQDAGTLEDVVEPFLLQIGFLADASRPDAHARGRAAHRRARRGPRAEAELF